jgi:O-antigen/teichoic acid export membrane protein
MISTALRLPLRLSELCATKTRTDTFSSNVAVVFVVRIVSMVIGVATGIILARALGPGGKGSYALITTFPALVFGFVHLGIAEANVYFLRKKAQQVDASIVRANTLYFTVLISTVTILLLLLFKPLLCASVLSGIGNKYFLAILVLIPFFLFETFVSSLLVAFERFKLLSTIDFFLRLFDTVIVLTVLYVLHFRLSGIIFGFILYFVVKCLVLFIFGFWRQPVRRYPSLSNMFSSVKFGIKSHAQSLTGILHYKVDIYILAIFLSMAEIGYYSVAVALVSLIFFIPNAVGHVMYPRIAGLNERDAHIFTAKACRNTLSITAIPAVVVVVFGRYGIGLLYGQDFLPACSAMYLLMPGTLAMCIYKILSNNFTSRNRQQITVFTGLSGLGINITLNLLLIPKLGIAGAAIATTASYSLTSFLLLFLFLRESRIPLNDVLFVKDSDIREIRHMIQKTLGQPQLETEAKT